jgi:hypothetical protein
LPAIPKAQAITAPPVFARDLQARLFAPMTQRIQNAAVTEESIASEYGDFIVVQ